MSHEPNCNWSAGRPVSLGSGPGVGLQASPGSGPGCPCSWVLMRQAGPRFVPISDQRRQWSRPSWPRAPGGGTVSVRAPAEGPHALSPGRPHREAQTGEELAGLPRASVPSLLTTLSPHSVSPYEARHPELPPF